MARSNQISALIPKKYGKTDLSFLDSDRLEDIEKGIRRLGVQSSITWLVTSFVLYKFIYDGKMFEASGFTWKEYRNDCRVRLGMDSRDLSEFLAAGRFLSMYGKQLAARDWNPERSARKVARAELALKLCNDSSLVIEHLVSDTWIDFNKWYTNLKMSAALPAPKRRKKAYEVIIRKGGRVFVDGREPVQIAEDIPDQERKDIAKLVRDYYLSKS